MVARFKVDPATGVMGLYHVPTPTSTDDSPLTDPLNHLDRVIFHPSLRYPGVVATISGTLALPARNGGGASWLTQRQTHVLAAHGRSGLPMIVGRILGIGVGGKSVPWVGTIPVQTYNGFGFVLFNEGTRWLTLGVVGGDIVAYERVVARSGTNPALSLDYEILVIDRDLTAPLPTSGPTRVRISGSAFLFDGPNGTLSSEQRFIRKAAAGAGFALSGGQTCTMRYVRTEPGTGAIIKSTTGNWSVGTDIYDLHFDNYVSAPAAAVSPTVQEVKI